MSYSSIADYLEIKRLGDQALRALDEGSSRIQRQLDLYEKYLELRRNHKVRVAGRFLVIEGKRAKKD